MCVGGACIAHARHLHDEHFMRRCHLHWAGTLAPPPRWVMWQGTWNGVKVMRPTNSRSATDALSWLYRKHYAEAVQMTLLARYCPLEVCIFVLLSCMWLVTGYLNWPAKYTVLLAMFTTWLQCCAWNIHHNNCVIHSSSEPFSLCDKFMPRPEIRTC